MVFSNGLGAAGTQNLGCFFFSAWTLTNSMAEFLGIQRTWVVLGRWAPRTDAYVFFFSMVIGSLSTKDRVVGPLPNGRTPWRINGGDPNHLLTGIILQVGDVISRNERVDTPLKFNEIPSKNHGTGRRSGVLLG